MKKDTTKPVEGTEKAAAQVAREMRRRAPAPKRHDVLIDYTYRKDRGEYVTIALNNDTALNLRATTVARLIELSQQPTGRKKT